MIYEEMNLSQLKDKVRNQISIIYPVFKKTNVHYLENSLLAIIVYGKNDTRYELFNFNHPDGELNHDETVLLNLDPDFLFAYESRYFKRYLKDKVYDIDLFQWFYLNKPYELEFSLERVYAERGFIEVGELIPMTKHFEYAENITINFNNSLNDARNGDYSLQNYRKYSESIFDTLVDLEYNGVRINESVLERLKIPLDGKFALTKYNLFTKTGRPSNSWRGINYSALGKEDGSRELIVSRFMNGQIVEFDYDAFHVKLIALLLGYDLGSENIHMKFGKEYFKKSTLTAEEYEMSKVITFRQLYSETVEYNSSFFDVVSKFKNELWDLYTSKGEIELPIIKRKLKGHNYQKMTKSKLFNYYIQGYETLYSVITLRKIIDILKDYNSLMILYVYDAYILDYDPADGAGLLLKILDCMSDSNISAHIKMGENYNEMKNCPGNLLTLGATL